MKGIVRLNVSLDPSIDFWELNPHMRFITPFNKLIDKKDSSKIMWCVSFICYPDEEDNKFFRFGREKIEEMLKETFYPELDTEDELYNECINAFPDTALDSVQRALLIKKKSLQDRARLLDNTLYTLDNSKKLDDMHKNTVKFMEDYDMILDKYLTSKKTNIIKGGRRQSKAEKGEI